MVLVIQAAYFYQVLPMAEYLSTLTFTNSYDYDNELRIVQLKKALKDKHLNPGLKVQYAKELQRIS